MLCIFDNAIERPANRHESQSLLSPDVGNGAAYLTMWCLCPELLAPKLKPTQRKLADFHERLRTLAAAIHRDETDLPIHKLCH